MKAGLYRKRVITALLPDKDTRRLVVLTGARQTGKTTLLKMAYPDLNYINLDAPENREYVRATSSFRWGESIGAAVLDEAQKEPSVFEKVKFAYDDEDINFTVLSGSAQILLLKSVRETLSGRVFIHELYPLMLCELCAENSNADVSGAPVLEALLNAKSVDSVIVQLPSQAPPRQADRLRVQENYLLKWGGMPGLLGLSDEERLRWHRAYAVTYLERDLSDLARLDSLEPFTKFERLAALRAGQILSYSEIGRDAGISADTARRYLEYLRISYQTMILPSYSRNLTSQVIKSPKLYWLDCGIWRCLTGYQGEVSGALFENMVVSEIYKYIKTMGRQAELSFYRTRSGLEIDLLVQTPRGIMGIEIKAREKVNSSDVTGLKKLAEALGNEWLGGLCVYRGLEIESMGSHGIWAVPSFRLLS